MISEKLLVTNFTLAMMSTGGGIVTFMQTQRHKIQLIIPLAKINKMLLIAATLCQK